MKKLLSLALAVFMLMGMLSLAHAEEKAYDLGGATVKVRLWDSPNPYDSETTEVDVARWLPVYEAAKAKYNCDFEFFTSTVEWDEMPNEFSMSVAAGQPVWHITNNLSAMWVPLLDLNHALNGTAEATKDLPMPASFTEFPNGFILEYPGTEGLVFNRAMIAEAGMEYDPGEMFAMGKWSYDDFFAYMTELQSKLPEGTYSFFIDPNYWQIFAMPANGTMTINTDYVPEITGDAFIESVEFLQKLVNAGLVRPANVTPEGQPDYWGTPGATFDVGVEVAMTHRATWQMGTLNTNGLDWGFVPYPWGSNVTLGTEGDYTTLSDSYRAAYYDTALCGVQLAGAENDFPGIEKAELTEALVHLTYDLFVDADRQEWLAGEIAGTNETELRMESFGDELSVELYNWLITRTGFNPLAALYNAHIGDFSYEGEMRTLSSLVRIVINNNLPPRATMEAFAAEIEAGLKDAGLAQ